MNTELSEEPITQPLHQTEAPYRLVVFGFERKLADRYCQTVTFRHQFRGKAILLVVSIEIVDPWHPAREVGDALATLISNELNKTTSQSLVARFEHSLKAANHFIADRQDRLTTQLHCAVALLAGEEVHLSAIGRSTVALGRAGQISYITPPAGDETAFGVVTSGDLQQTDWLIIGSPAVRPVAEQTTETLERADQNNQGISSANIKTLSQEPWSAAFIQYQPDAPRSEKIYFDHDSSTMIVPDELRQRGPLQAFSGTLSSGAKFLPIVVSTTKTLAAQIAKLPWRSVVNRLPLRFRKPAILAAVAIVIILVGIFGWRQTHRPAAQSPAPTKALVQAMSLPNADFSVYLSEHFTLSDYQALDGAEQASFKDRIKQTGFEPLELPTALATLAKDGQLIDRSGDDWYAIDTTGQIWGWKNQTLAAVTQSQSIPQAVGFIALNNQWIVSDQIGNIWLVKADGAVSSLSLPTDLKSGVKLLAKFETNLYIYGQATGAIYRATNFINDLSKAAVYIKKETIPLGTVQDLAVNSQIVAIDATGKIQDFKRNQPGSFAATLPGLPGSAHVDTQVDNTRIMAVSGRLLTIYPADQPTAGKTYFVLTDRALTDVAVSKTGLFLLDGAAVYQLAL
jgi:hypothetical protein